MLTSPAEGLHACVAQWQWLSKGLMGSFGCSGVNLKAGVHLPFWLDQISWRHPFCILESFLLPNISYSFNMSYQVLISNFFWSEWLFSSWRLLIFMVWPCRSRWGSTAGDDLWDEVCSPKIRVSEEKDWASCCQKGRHPSQKLTLTPQHGHNPNDDARPCSMPSIP